MTERDPIDDALRDSLPSESNAADGMASVAEGSTPKSGPLGGSPPVDAPVDPPVDAPADPPVDAPVAARLDLPDVRVDLPVDVRIDLPVDPRVGTLLSDRYRLERLLGEGAMGAVYLAEHTLMLKRVAVKVLHAEMTRLPEVVARFEREAVAAGRIEHPNVAAATDFGKLDDGSFFLVLEYVEGQSLRRRLNRGALPVATALKITRQVASGLARAHDLGIVHRDLKPENLMLVERDGEPDFVKILDFGIARVPMDDLSAAPRGSTEAITRAGMVYGTPEYMSPEQALGQEVDARADLYALGVMLYEMLTGWRPFDAESKVQLIGMQVTAPVPTLAEKAPDAHVPEIVESLVRQLMAKEAAHRPPSARDVVERIAAIEAAGIRVTASPPSQGIGEGVGEPRSGSWTAAESAESASARSQRLSDSDGNQPTIPAPPNPPSLGTRATELYHRAPRLTTGVLAAVGVLVMGVSLMAFCGSSSSTRHTTTGRADSSTIAPPKKVGVAEAVRLFERGDIDGGRAKLAAASPGPEDLPAVYEAMAKGYFATARPTEAIGELDHLAAVVPAAANKPEFVAELRKATTSGDGAEAAFHYIESHPTERIVDLLYDLGWVLKVDQTVSDRAQRALRTPPVRAEASPAAAVAIDLRTVGQTCDAKPFIKVASAVGDARSLPLLRAVQKPRVTKLAGHYKSYDLLGCLHGDDAIARAIASIEARAPKRP